MAESPLALADLLNDLGFDSSAAQSAAKAALVAAKLTNPSKQNISSEKRPRVEETLRSTFLISCGAAACARTASGRAVIVAHDRANCWVCEGSDNRRAMDQAAALLKSRGVRKIVVVGGSPAVHEQLRELAPSEWELRLVIGVDHHTGAEARGHLRWADLVMIWGSSELDHKVSEHYTSAHSDRVVRIARRGVAALLEGAMRWAKNRPEV